jgi:uncharacterized protein YihD (DUF1040 family)
MKIDKIIDIFNKHQWQYSTEENLNEIKKELSDELGENIELSHVNGEFIISTEKSTVKFGQKLNS